MANDKVTLIILSGIPGSGKSTIAKKLEKSGFKHFFIDEFYKKLSDTTALEWGREFEIEGYKLFRKALYEELEQKNNLVIETTGASDKWIEIFGELKERTDIQLIDILLDINLEEAIRRIDDRNRTEHPHKVPIDKLEGWMKRVNEVRNYQYTLDVNRETEQVLEKITKLI